jgi:hypothetical protein
MPTVLRSRVLNKLKTGTEKGWNLNGLGIWMSGFGMVTEIPIRGPK